MIQPRRTYQLLEATVQPIEWTIPFAYRHMRQIYADANALTTPRQERFNFLVAAWADLSRNYRKKAAHNIPIAVAQTYAWSMSLLEELLRREGGHALNQAMCTKYPHGHCSYCGRSPCACKQELRPAATLAEVSSEQLGWSLSLWQVHLHGLYGAANKAAGVAQSINRLGEEISELGALLNYVDGFNAPLDEMRHLIAMETTDVFAWICTSASLLDVDFERAVRGLYGAGCPVCGSKACTCPNFVKRPRTGALTHRFMPAEEIQTFLCA